MRFCMTTPVGGILGSCDFLLQASLTFALAGLLMITKLLLPSVKAPPTWNTCHGFSVEFWFTGFIFSKVLLDLFSQDKNDQVLTLLGTKHQDYNYQVGFTLCILKQRAKIKGDLNSGLKEIGGKTIFWELLNKYLLESTTYTFLSISICNEGTTKKEPQKKRTTDLQVILCENCKTHWPYG